MTVLAIEKVRDLKNAGDLASARDPVFIQRSLEARFGCTLDEFEKDFDSAVHQVLGSGSAARFSLVEKNHQALAGAAGSLLADMVPDDDESDYAKKRILISEQERRVEEQRKAARKAAGLEEDDGETATDSDRSYDEEPEVWTCNEITNCFNETTFDSVAVADGITLADFTPLRDAGFAPLPEGFKKTGNGTGNVPDKPRHSSTSSSKAKTGVAKDRDRPSDYNPGDRVLAYFTAAKEWYPATVVGYKGEKINVKFDAGEERCVDEIHVKMEQSPKPQWFCCLC